MSPYQVITAPQIKAARGLLEWGQDQLAAASGLSAKTIRALENGSRSPRSLMVVKAAIEAAGLDFIGVIGVKRKEDQIRTLRGVGCTVHFLNTVMETIRDQGGELLFMGRSLDFLAKGFGVARFTDHALSDLLAPIGTVRCIVSDEPSLSARAAFWPTMSCRLTNEHAIGPGAYIIYGNRTAQIHKDSCGGVWFLLMDCPSTILQNRSHFLSVWNSAVMISATQANHNSMQTTRRIVKIGHALLPKIESCAS